MACCTSASAQVPPTLEEENGPTEESSASQDLTADVKHRLLLDSGCTCADPESCQEDNSHISVLVTSPVNLPSDIQTDDAVASGSSCNSESKVELLKECPVESSENPSEDESYHGVTIVDLPTEVFLQLCSYLDARFLIQTLRLVCRRFNFILSDGFVWRSRISRTWNRIYPAIPSQDEDSVDWGDACMRLEDQKNLWSNKEQTMLRTTWKNAHFSCVDSVLLINEGALCVSGSRDHCLAVWDVDSFKDQPLAHVEGHKGWVWRLTADSKSSFYSCSFDNTVKHWKLEPDLRETTFFDCKMPVMSIASADNFFAASFQNNEVWLFDRRADVSPVHKYNLNKGFALALGLICENGSPDLVISAGNGGYVSVWDIRAGKLLKDSQKVSPKPKYKSTLLSMSLQKDSCYFGDSGGRLYLMDPRRESETAFEIIATYDAGHRAHSKVNTVCHGKGYLLSGGSDGIVNVFAPTHEPERITSFTFEKNTEVACVDYKHNILVVGGSDSLVQAYKPIYPYPD